MLQIQLLIAQANLLRIQLLSEGYVAENQSWVVQGQTPCYPEASFQYLAQEVQTQIEELQKLLPPVTGNPDALKQGIVTIIADCCGTTLDKRQAVTELQKLMGNADE